MYSQKDQFLKSCVSLCECIEDAMRRVTAAPHLKQAIQEVGATFGAFEGPEDDLFVLFRGFGELWDFLGDLGRRFGSLWRPLGDFWGDFGGPLGSLGEALGFLWVRFETSWGALGGSLGAFGVHMEPFWWQIMGKVDF